MAAKYPVFPTIPPDNLFRRSPIFPFHIESHLDFVYNSFVERNSFPINPITRGGVPMSTLKATVSMLEAMPEDARIKVREITQQLFTSRKPANPFVPVSQEQVLSGLAESRRQIAAGQGLNMERASLSHALPGRGSDGTEKFLLAFLSQLIKTLPLPPFQHTSVSCSLYTTIFWIYRSSISFVRTAYPLSAPCLPPLPFSPASSLSA